MKKIIEGIKYWGQLLLLPVYWFSFLFPRNKRIWLFGSTFGRRFADNPRYFFLYCSQHREELDIRPIWISHDKGIVKFLNENGYEAYYYHSLKGIWYALRGRIYFFDNYSKDINFWQSGGALKFNMWHGVGNKCINYDNRHDRVRHPRNGWERFKFFPRRLSDEKPSHYILATSPMIGKIFVRAFQVQENHVIETGYPRNDILFKENSIENVYLTEEKLLQQHIKEWKQGGQRLLGYFPTFRRSETKFFEVCDLKAFNTFLQENNMIFICKLHPKSACKDAFEAVDYSHIYVVKPEVDMNSFLGDIDLLVADYSSVYSDFMLLNRPVVAFHYDYEEYSGDTRDAYFDYEEYMPEVKAYNMQELEDSICRVLEKDEASEKRKRFCKKLYKNMDGNSCRRLVKEIQQLM